METRRALILINPEARHPPKARALEAGIEWLAEQGWKIESRVTERRGEVEEAAAMAAASGFDCVVACGGDGTLHEALNGLAGTQTALALLPGGTANVWAREAHLPRDPEKALHLLVEGDRLRIDTGCAGGRSFLLMAGIGLDSLVAGRVDSRLKRTFGFLPYLGHAALALSGFDGFEATIKLDGETLQAPLVGLLIGNTRSYGGVIEITSEARADDGLLDVCLYQGSTRVGFLAALFNTLLRRHLRQDNVIYKRAQTIVVETNPCWPVQLDGEIVAETPVTITCVPQSLTVIVPPGLRSPLWDSGSDAV